MIGIAKMVGILAGDSQRSAAETLLSILIMHL